MIDITPADQEIVTTILKKHVPHAEVRVFGSRHKWTAKPYSDLDLAIVADAKLEKQIIYDLEEAFEESELSFRVDVIDWYAISDEFRAIIEQGYTVIQEKKEALPAGWVMKKLGEISIKLASGATPKGGDSSYKSSGISLIRSQNILDFTFSYNGLVFIDNDQANKLQNVEIKENDVLINITGDSVTRCCSVPNQVLPARVNQHVMIIRVNNKVCDSNYIKYYLLNPISKSHLLSLSSSGATRKALTKTMMDNLKIWLPPLQEQKKIAAILSSLDDKIELNQHINKKLEEIAQCIFDYYFMNSDYDLYPLKEIIDFNPSYKLSNLCSVAYLEMANIQTNFYRASNWIYRKAGSGSKFKNGDTLFARITPCLENGKTCFVDFLDNDEVAYGSTEYIIMRSKNKFHPFLSYLIARNQDFRNYAISTMIGTSGRQRAQADKLEHFEIKLPPNELLFSINSQLEPIVSMLKNTSEQIEYLITMRDTLLPKLISGEILA